MEQTFYNTCSGCWCVSPRFPSPESRPPLPVRNFKCEHSHTCPFLQKGVVSVKATSPPCGWGQQRLAEAQHQAFPLASILDLSRRPFQLQHAPKGLALDPVANTLPFSFSFCSCTLSQVFLRVLPTDLMHIRIYLHLRICFSGANLWQCDF